MSGTAMVVKDTGEIVQHFDRSAYLSELASPQALAYQNQLAAAYDATCRALIGADDVQVEGGRTFKKKSAWRKLARHFAISTSVVNESVSAVGEFTVARSIVRATAPWGQSVEAIGACGTDEATGRRTITIADAVATAQTRATNRAISELIAMGEVSHEELSQGARAHSAPAAPRAGGSGKRGGVIPFGELKGKSFADAGAEAVQKLRDWCVKKDATKFGDLIAECEDFLGIAPAGGASEYTYDEQGNVV
jgi:hypothetical protein